MKNCLAIDFGTTNSVLARWNEEHGHAELITLPGISQVTPPPLVPSLVYVKDGANADILFGQPAREMLGTVPPNERIFRDFKRGLLTTDEAATRSIDGTPWNHGDAGKHFVSALIHNLPFPQNEIDQLVLTVPVTAFSHYLGWLTETFSELKVEKVRVVDEYTTNLNILNGVASVSGITVAILVMNRINRRTMLLFGFVGITVAHLLIGLSSLTLPEGLFRAYMILLFVIIFVFIMQGTAGPLVWLMLAEIFPLEMRGFAIGISVFLLWVTNFFVGLFFPSLVAGVGISSTFFLFAAIGVISVVFIYTMVPETRGKTLEQLEEQFRGKFGQGRSGSPQAARVE